MLTMSTSSKTRRYYSPLSLKQRTDEEQDFLLVRQNLRHTFLKTSLFQQLVDIVAGLVVQHQVLQVFARHCNRSPCTVSRGSVSPCIGGLRHCFHHLMRMKLRVSSNGEQKGSNSHFLRGVGDNAVQLRTGLDFAAPRVASSSSFICNSVGCGICVSLSDFGPCHLDDSVNVLFSEKKKKLYGGIVWCSDLITFPL